MEDKIDLRWRKSSLSGNGGGSCVAVVKRGAAWWRGTRRTFPGRCCGSVRPRGADSLNRSNAR